MLRRKSKGTDSGIEPAALSSAQLEDLIASRAYELYEMRGATAGDELSDWLTAEREILAALRAPKAKAAETAGREKAVLTAGLREKSSELMPAGGSRKKDGPSTSRSPAKPKGVHP